LAKGINPKGLSFILAKILIMIVFVLNKHGEQLMPCKPRKAKKLLNEEKAKVIRRSPFTIQLLYGSSGYKQNLTLGVDTGHKEVGLSVLQETRNKISDTTNRSD